MFDGFKAGKQYIRRKRNASCVIVISETKDKLDPTAATVDVADHTKTTKKCTEEDWECEDGYDEQSDGSSGSICRL